MCLKTQTRNALRIAQCESIEEKSQVFSSSSSGKEQEPMRWGEVASSQRRALEDGARWSQDGAPATPQRSPAFVDPGICVAGWWSPTMNLFVLEIKPEISRPCFQCFLALSLRSPATFPYFHSCPGRNQKAERHLRILFLNKSKHFQVSFGLCLVFLRPNYWA